MPGGQVTLFTGIIQTVGTVRFFAGSRLVVDAPSVADWESWQTGESVAVNGCCLTVVEFTDGLAFDLSEETLRRTNLAEFRAGTRVNLERAMRASDRFGGHIVQGHVDAVGTVVSVLPNEAGAVYRFRVPEAKYLIDKGSIALNGVSLTVVEPNGGDFDVWLIPHTLEATNLGDLQSGSQVNVEYDVIAKHVEKLIAQ